MEIWLRKDWWNVTGQHQGFSTINLKCFSLSFSGVNCWAIIIFFYLFLWVTQFVSCQDRSSLTLIMNCWNLLFYLMPMRTNSVRRYEINWTLELLKNFISPKYFTNQCLIFFFFFVILKAIKRSQLYLGLHTVENFKTE